MTLSSCQQLLSLTAAKSFPTQSFPCEDVEPRPSSTSGTFCQPCRNDLCCCWLDLYLTYCCNDVFTGHWQSVVRIQCSSCSVRSEFGSLIRRYAHLFAVWESVPAEDKFVALKWHRTLLVIGRIIRHFHGSWIILSLMITTRESVNKKA